MRKGWVIGLMALAMTGAVLARHDDRKPATDPDCLYIQVNADELIEGTRDWRNLLDRIAGMQRHCQAVTYLHRDGSTEVFSL
jgi:hypothetical protein